MTLSSDRATIAAIASAMSGTPMHLGLAA